MDTATIVALAGTGGTLVGTVVGAGASIWATWLNTKHAAELQQATVQAQEDQQRRAFQRETLLALQDEIGRALMFAGAAYIEDRASFRQTGDWSASRNSGEVSAGYIDSKRAVSKLSARVTDEALRNRIKSLQDLLHDWSMAQSQEEALAYANDVAERVPEFNEQLGAALRAQY